MVLVIIAVAYAAFSYSIYYAKFSRVFKDLTIVGMEGAGVVRFWDLSGGVGGVFAWMMIEVVGASRSGEEVLGYVDELR